MGTGRGRWGGEGGTVRSLSQITANPIGTSRWAGGGFLFHTLMDITSTDSSPVHRIVVYKSDQ